MKLRKSAVTIASVVIISILSGCYFGQTHIHSNAPGQFEVYGNGELLCENGQYDCKISQRGGPQTLELVVVKDDVAIGHTQIKREITAASVFWMFFTYFTSLYLYQAYPDEAFIFVDDTKIKKTSSFGNNGSSNWDKSPFSASDSWNSGNSGNSTDEEEYAPVF